MTTRVDSSVPANSLVSADSRCLYSAEVSSHFLFFVAVNGFSGKTQPDELPVVVVVAVVLLVTVEDFSGATCP